MKKSADSAASWPRVKLGEVCEVKAGDSAPQDKALFIDGVYPFVRTSDVGAIHFGALNESRDKLNEAGTQKLHLFKAGSILFPKSGASTFLNHRVLLDVDAYVASHLAVITPGGKVNSKYLLNLLAQVDAKDLMQDTSYPALRTSEIEDVEIDLPPLSVQHSIVERLERELGAVDKLVKKFEELETAAEAEFKAELKETFEGFEGACGGRGATALPAHGRARAPREPQASAVCRVKLGEVCERITKGTTPTSVGHSFTDTGVNFVKVESFSEEGHLLGSKIAHISRKCHEELERSQLREGDLLFSIAGALGRVAKVDAKILPANTNQALAIIRLAHRATIDVDYLMLALRSPLINMQIDEMKKATAQANLSLQNVRDFVFPLPPLAVQREIVARLDTAKEKKEALVAAAKRGREAAALWRKAILKEAFE